MRFWHHWAIRKMIDSSTRLFRFKQNEVKDILYRRVLNMAKPQTVHETSSNSTRVMYRLSGKLNVLGDRKLSDNDSVSFITTAKDIIYQMGSPINGVARPDRVVHNQRSA